MTYSIVLVLGVQHNDLIYVYIVKQSLQQVEFIFITSRGYKLIFLVGEVLRSYSCGHFHIYIIHIVSYSHQAVHYTPELMQPALSFASAHSSFSFLSFLFLHPSPLSLFSFMPSILLLSFFFLFFLSLPFTFFFFYIARDQDLS